MTSIDLVPEHVYLPFDADGSSDLMVTKQRAAREVEVLREPMREKLPR